MIADPVSDLVSRINNCVRARKRLVYMPCSKYKLALLSAIKSCGYLERVSVLRHSAYKADALAEITYIAGEPLISSIIQISKPGRRVYWNRRTLKAQTCRRFGTFLLSTAKGIVNTAAALPMFGGEVVCKLI
ncbi:MAG: 30S ribosomal protein S8 [Candidatus Hodgkinia cicadicola]